MRLLAKRGTRTRNGEQTICVPDKLDVAVVLLLRQEQQVPRQEDGQHLTEFLLENIFEKIYMYICWKAFLFSCYDPKTYSTEIK
jgi:hypothetical protein